ncbi:hypothetical protein ACFCV3_03265 [Kribbella sp. NPDC056345]|uniref:hypothetical protein n=1 Tax=Kribbella sp. NPDC056345 TaxID=3345789 RepID=UPI0035DB36A8
MQFLEDPRGGERLWRLLSGNNRPLAMGRGGRESPQEELAAVRRLARDAEPALRRDPEGRWRWELVADNGPDVRCPGVFARRIDARRAFHRFTQAVELAEVTSGHLTQREQR